MTPEDAYLRCRQAVDAGDESAAEFWLFVLKFLNDEVEDREIARAVRECELWAMAQTIEWKWVE